MIFHCLCPQVVDFLHEQNQRTHGQSRRGAGSRVGGGDVCGRGQWWGKMETTVVEQH